MVGWRDGGIENQGKCKGKRRIPRAEAKVA